MSNEEMARQIAQNRPVNVDEYDLCIYAATEMAKWKDEQVKSVLKLEKKSPYLKKSEVEAFLIGSKDIRNYNELFDAIKDKYPKGNREGCGVSWRCSREEFKARLRNAEAIYEVIRDSDNEQIIKAVTSYIDSFNGDYKYLPSMKYLIMKTEGADKSSRLADILETYNDMNSIFNVDYKKRNER